MESQTRRHSQSSRTTLNFQHSLVFKVTITCFNGAFDARYPHIHTHKQRCWQCFWIVSTPPNILHAAGEIYLIRGKHGSDYERLRVILITQGYKETIRYKRPVGLPVAAPENQLFTICPPQYFSCEGRVSGRILEQYLNANLYRYKRVNEVSTC